MIDQVIKTVFKSEPDIGWNIEQAYAKRKCNVCDDDILKNEWHLATYHMSRRHGYNQRRNVCMHCGLPAMIKRRDASKLVVEAIEAYLTIHPEIKNRKILKQMQDGTYKKEG